MPWSDYPILGQGQETFLAPPADKQIYIYIYIYIFLDKNYMIARYQYTGKYLGV